MRRSAREFGFPLQVPQDPLDHLTVLDAGDDLEVTDIATGCDHDQQERAPGFRKVASPLRHAIQEVS